MPSQDFEQLPMPRQSFPQAVAGNYRVYSDASHFITVNATSAIQALQSSGLADACKIERDSLDLTSVFSPKDWTLDEPETSTPDLQTTAQEAGVDADAAKQTVEVPLTQEEVNNLTA